MKLLLDTHAFIWFFNGDAELPLTVKEAIEDLSNDCFISIGSIWEIAIKTSLQKLQLKGSFGDIATFIEENNIELLPITFTHTEKLRHLPFHHRDPFDRMIIAQALTDNLTVATKDGVFQQYGIRLIWQ